MLKNWRLRAVLLALVALLLFGCSVPATQAPEVTEAVEYELETYTVDSMRTEEGVTIIDVREDWEYAAGHIPGAKLIPLGQLPDRLDEVPTDDTVILVCRSGSRSRQAFDYLRQQGFDNVRNMLGGMNTWIKNGYEVNICQGGNC